jgi:hypothetical protein
MATERGREIFLAVLLVVLAFFGYRAWSSLSVPQATAPATAPANARPQAPRSDGAAAASRFDVHLEALSAERTDPGPVQRNLFRFKPKAPPPRPADTRPAFVAPSVPAAPAGPPPPPPITLKFIGVLESTVSAQKIAILSDGTGVSLYGKEGDVLGGQYRILKIGVESIEMSYLDGRGRQIIRLSGS